ncbi:DUF6122 family protein [Pedobacter alpinus]|uniref:DUF6122 family protein n=1 Tax=Pedobacter alpinus TaxID=1590643 RepID=A0ABW5TTE4_9SPHI
MQNLIHYTLHLIFPALIAYVFFRKEWKKAYFILLCTLLIDIDHLFANPIFAANRCSIGFHPLHSLYIIPVYIGLLFFKKPLRIVAIGLLFHLFTDFIDCLFIFSKCKACVANNVLANFIHNILEFFGF